MGTRKSFTLAEKASDRRHSLSLYFHYPCFDGLVSAVLTSKILRQHNACNSIRFHPVDYDDRKGWISRPVDLPCAVVDFLYHPRASFWADHHLTTFLNEELRADFFGRQPDPCFLFDVHSPSCAALLWRQFGSILDDRFVEMVRWASKIDSASYDSVREAIFGDAPALQIHSSLMLRNGTAYCKVLLRELESGDLHRVADLPEVRARYAEVRAQKEAGLKRVEERVRLEEGGIVTFDVEAHENDIISRYAPYYFFERARYSLGVIRLEDRIRITAMRNPWLDFKSIPLGPIFERFGGGGHERVASVILPLEQAQRISEIVEHVKLDMRSQPLARVVA